MVAQCSEFLIFEIRLIEVPGTRCLPVKWIFLVISGNAFIGSNLPTRRPYSGFTSLTPALGLIARGRDPYAWRQGPSCGTPPLPVLSRPLQ